MEVSNPSGSIEDPQNKGDDEKRSAKKRRVRRRPQCNVQPIPSSYAFVKHRYAVHDRSPEFDSGGACWYSTHLSERTRVVAYAGKCKSWDPEARSEPLEKGNPGGKLRRDGRFVLPADFHRLYIVNGSSPESKPRAVLSKTHQPTNPPLRLFSPRLLSQFVTPTTRKDPGDVIIESMYLRCCMANQHSTHGPYHTP